MYATIIKSSMIPIPKIGSGIKSKGEMTYIINAVKNIFCHLLTFGSFMYLIKYLKLLNLIVFSSKYCLTQGFPYAVADNHVSFTVERCLLAIYQNHSAFIEFGYQPRGRID